MYSALVFAFYRQADWGLNPDAGQACHAFDGFCH